MIAAKSTLFIKKDSSGRNNEGIRAWKVENNQHGACVIGEIISPLDEHIRQRISYVFYPINKAAITHPTKWTLVKTMESHKFWSFTGQSGYKCPGIAITRENQEPRPQEYCCFQDKYLKSDIQTHKTQQALGSFVKDFSMIQAPDTVTNLLPTGHFTMPGSKALLVVSDGEKVINDDNFDYDPSRALDLIEVTTVNQVAQGDFKNHVMEGSETKFSFWKASGEGKVHIIIEFSKNIRKECCYFFK